MIACRGYDSRFCAEIGFSPGLFTRSFLGRLSGLSDARKRQAFRQISAFDLRLQKINVPGDRQTAPSALCWDFFQRD
jgi:hypothetical protein